MIHYRVGTTESNEPCRELKGKKKLIAKKKFHSSSVFVAGVRVVGSARKESHHSPGFYTHFIFFYFISCASVRVNVPFRPTKWLRGGTVCRERPSSETAITI